MSELSLRLRTDEIEAVSKLHDCLWDWLSIKSKTPILNQEIPIARVQVSLRGAAEETLTALERVCDLSPLRRSNFHLAFHLEQRNIIETRSPVSIESQIDVAQCMAEIEPSKNVLAAGQLGAFRALLARISTLYTKRATQRRKNLERLALEALGHGAASWLSTPDWRGRSPKSLVENNFEYEKNVEILLQKKRRGHSQKKTYVWHASG